MRRDFKSNRYWAPWVLTLILLLGAGLVGPGAQAAEDVVIGVMTPLTGPYSFEASTQVHCAQLAVEQINAAGGVLGGRKIKLVVEDTMLKPGIGVNKARKLIERDKVKFLTGGVSSAVTLAISNLAVQYKVVHLGIGGSNALTNKKCNRYHINLDTAAYQMATGTGVIVVDQLKLPKEWFCITADYTWGHTCFDSVKRFLESRKGKVVGNVFSPLGTKDFSPYLTKALAAKAPVLCGIVYGGDQVRFLKQVEEFGLKDKMKIVVPAGDVTISKAAGPDAVAGVYVGLPWYWDIPNQTTQAFSKAYFARFNEYPSWAGVQVYDSIKVLAEAIEEVGSLDTGKIIKALEGKKFQTSKGPEQIRACDHRAIQDYYVGIGKSAKEMKNSWDMLKIVGSTGGEQIMIPCAQTGCKMGAY